MTPKEAATALRKAREACDAFCGACAQGEGGCQHQEHWTMRRCSACVDAGTDCNKLYVLGGALDCGGNQAGLIRRVHEGTLDAEQPPYWGNNSRERLFGLILMPDGVHFNKSLDGHLHHYKVWDGGWLCGYFQLWSCFYDADPVYRERARKRLSLELLRRKNPYSVEHAVRRRDRDVIEILLRDEERRTCRAWRVHTLGPSRWCKWNENTEGMYHEPMGSDFHERSNLLFYVDHRAAQVRVLQVAHSPCNNAAVTVPAKATSTAQDRLRKPVDLALLKSVAYVTDASAERPALYGVDVSHVTTRFNAAGEGAAEAERGGGGKARVTRVKLSGTPVLQMPYGIVALNATSELFVTEQHGRRVVRITLSSASAGVIEPLCTLPTEPAGVALVPQCNSLVVAAGDAVYLVSTRHGAAAAATRVLHRPGADFCGVQIAPNALNGALFAIDNSSNAVLCLERVLGAESVAGPTFQPSIKAVVLAGGNAERPCSGKQSVWYEGTAARVELWGPTFGTFMRNSFVFMNSGSGSFGKVLVLNDIYPLAAHVLPTLLLAADAFALTADARQHAPDRLQSALMLKSVSDLLFEIEDGNAAVNPARGLQGPMGNFSGCLRKSAQQLSDQLFQQVTSAVELGAPQRVVQSLMPAATTTLNVETYFTSCRQQYPNPYMLQFAQGSAISMDIEAARRGESAFSFCTSSDNSRAGRAHYSNPATLTVAPRRRQLQKGKPKQLDPPERQKRLGVLRTVAGIFKQARAGRVTDRGKERHGTLPSTAYAPRAITKPTAREPARTSMRSRADAAAASTTGRSDAATSSAGPSTEMQEVLYRAGDLVSVRPISGGMWVGQLLDPIIKITGVGGVRFNVDRVKVRYFVPTVELSSYPDAMHFWSSGQGGMQRRLSDATAAEQRAAQSDGEHYSFEKEDRVTRTTVRSRFVRLSEEVHHRSKLVSFALTTDSVLEARAATAGGADNPIESDDEGEAADRQAEREAIAGMAAAAAAIAHSERLHAPSRTTRSSMKSAMLAGPSSST